MAEHEVETVSVASSESFADQGYAASEGMAEESVPVSPSERMQSVSPMSANQSKDSSDSDEGCATWGSRQRYAHVHMFTVAINYHSNQKPLSQASSH